MNTKHNKNIKQKEDKNAVNRKQDHIELAFESGVNDINTDKRFFYEPALHAHPEKGSLKPVSFLGKTLKAPIWISSMTGGTEKAKTINHNLARACKEFGLGMGLGSCRQLLNSDEFLPDFDVRYLMGDNLPLYANLGIAQIEKLIKNNEFEKITTLLEKIKADGLIIHINPMQEWLQPEGNIINVPPVITITKILEKSNFPVIVKEVGQGMGYKSLKALFQLPLEAIEFAAFGGTNFSKLELLRNNAIKFEAYGDMINLGHSAEEMTNMTNKIIEELGDKLACKQVIISGGIKNFLDGYYYCGKLKLPAIYGQASSFLKYAKESYEDLQEYIKTQIHGLEFANTFLTIK